MKKILVGMSGGVDSSAAALLLKRQGYEVVGVTLDLLPGDAPFAAAEDAKKVAAQLGIAHHTINCKEEFSHHVMDYFTAEYLAGRTPNPCIACNKYIKFGAMARIAGEFGCDAVATGHYARIEQNADGRYLLKKSASAKKDQTYVLYTLSQQQLSRAMFPLEGLEKEEIRALAAEAGLAVAQKKDSQEICFIPDDDYVRFLSERCKELPPEGNFVDLSGNVLGRHKGIVHYTVGQRKGLGIAFGKPMFVVSVNPRDNTVTLGEAGSEFSSTLMAEQTNFIPFDTLDSPMRVQAKVRYSAPAADAWIEPVGDGVRVTFDAPQRAVTPGQAVVFYDGDTVVGGGVIGR